MKNSDFCKEQLMALISDVLDGSVDAAGHASLNELLKASPEARNFYRDHMELHARLHLDYNSGNAEFMPSAVTPVTHQRSSWFSIRKLVVAAACLAILAVIAWPHDSGTEEFATLEDSRAARWDSSDLPTAEGSRLGRGTLRLVEGLVTLRFDSGAEVKLEAPVEMTLVDAMHCTLHRGIAVADIPDSAIGFRIETPAVDVVDYGTRFSVIVDGETNETHTQVYEGLVEVEHPPSGEVVALKAGQLNSANESGLAKVVSAQGNSYWPTTVGPEVRGPEWSLLKTSKDTYIGRAYIDDAEVHRSETLLLVKGSQPYRKSYLGFDLAGIEPERIADAELMLHFAPTGWGLASLVPDATFSVYGLLADQAWDEESLDYGNAPANTWRSRRGLVDSEVRKLGSFLVEQGVQRGQFGIGGESLAAFLREHAGSEITLIVVRDTGEFETNGLVHGFASRRHPILPAPTLAIRNSVR